MRGEGGGGTPVNGGAQAGPQAVESLSVFGNVLLRGGGGVVVEVLRLCVCVFVCVQQTSVELKST